jgi:hypothetical protein
MITILFMTTIPGNFEYERVNIGNSDQRKQYNKCVLHLISIISTDDDNDYITVEMIHEKYMNNDEFWNSLKVGDLIENVEASGYRSEGLYIVDENLNTDFKHRLIITELHTKYDDYGTVLPHFYAITKFPIDYFEMAYSDKKHQVLVNTHFCDGKHLAYWHTDPCIMPIDKEILRINQLKKSGILSIDLGHCKIYGIIVKFQDEQYFLTSYDDTAKDFLSLIKNVPFYTIENLIESFTYFSEDSKEKKNNRAILSKITKFLHKNKIDFENAYLLSQG